MRAFRSGLDLVLPLRVSARALRRTALFLSLGVALGMASAGPAGAAISTGTTTRVSVDSSGVQGNVSSSGASLSSDGRYVAFASGATNLVFGDTNAAQDIFVRDRVAGTTIRVSVNSSGVQANGHSYEPCISADGSCVAFRSSATNLVASDNNASDDVFVHDRVSGLTTRASVSSASQEGDGHSFAPSLSSDGRYVAFESRATNLVAGDTNARQDVFVRDRDLNATTRVSVDTIGVQGNLDSGFASVSADGRYVAFASRSSNLVVGDTNAVDDVFVKDRLGGGVIRVSANSSYEQGTSNSARPSISSDGRYVAFESLATNLVAGDTNGQWDVFVNDSLTGGTTRVSVDSAGVQGGALSIGPSISGDGRYVAFASLAGNLVAGDTNAIYDAFVRDRTAGTTTRVSVDSSGVQGTGYSDAPSISGDGRFVAFHSAATNLVAGDTNSVDDVFVHEAPPVATSITIKTNATTAYIGSIPILSGAVTPMGMIGRNIVAYVKKPGKTYWTYSSNRTVYLLSGKAAWQYKYYFKPGMVKGLYVFKAVAPAPGFASSAGFATSTSPTTVTIRLR